MNKWLRTFSFAFAMLAVLFLSAAARAQDKKNSRGESFYIIGSVDRARSQILLKRPTEVTILIKVDDKTQFLDENGKPIKLADLQTGNTVWVAASGGDQPVASRIRKGPMTVEELHQLYLDYPEVKY
jgi:hypothetical protein